MNRVRFVKPRKVIHMHDLRLVVARKLVWKEEAWREPAYVAQVIRGLRDIVADEDTDKVSRAEAEMLIKKLNKAIQRPDRYRPSPPA